MDETTSAVWTKLLPVSKLVSEGKTGCFLYTALDNGHLTSNLDELPQYFSYRVTAFFC